MPPVLLNVLLFSVGIVGLYFGAEWLVLGAGRMARALGVAALVVGLTVVAFGTSAPELVVSTIASARGDGELALGNVLGSNVMNIALILGLSSVVLPIRVEASVIRREIPVMIALTVMVGALGLDGSVGRVDAAILLTLFVAYLVLVLRSARGEDPSVEATYREHGRPPVGELGTGPMSRSALLALGGIIVMVIGARLLVDASIFFARALGASELVIGLTVVAVGTSLPELATSLVAAYRGKTDIAVGNIVGSNVFNLCAILGVASLVAPIPFPAPVLRVEYVLMLLISLLLLPLAKQRNMITRANGLLLLVAYVGFTVLVVARAL